MTAWEIIFQLPHFQMESFTAQVVAVRKAPRGRWLKGSLIPPHVLRYCEADATGEITEESTLQMLEELSEGKRKISLTESIPDPPNPSRYGDPPTWSWEDDDVGYVEAGVDGAYFTARLHNKTWWALASWDISGGDCGTLAEEPGYSSKRAARTAAEDAAREWAHYQEDVNS
jgi:hypothetical protein